MSTRKLVINSRDRDYSSQTSNNFTVQLTRPIKATTVKLDAVDIPNTIYNVNSSNNVIYFNDGTNRTATVTPGNYTAQTLKTAVDAAFAASGTALTITYSYSSQTMKVTITASGAITLTFGTNTTNSMAQLLGYPSVNSSSSTTQVASYALQLTSLPLLLTLDFVNNNYFTTGEKYSSFIIPVNAEGGYTISYRSAMDFPQSATSTTPFLIQQFTVKLTNFDATFVELNGGEWWMAVSLE
jgi:hypothetical protein